MAEPNNYESHIFGFGFERCPDTGRPYECGSGALSKAAQTANFVRAARAADMPKEGECCLQTGRPFETGSGALPKKLQTAAFLREASPAAKAARVAAYEALVAMTPAGQA